MRVVSAAAWHAEAAAHRDRMLSVLHGTIHHSQQHPVWNFLFTYYSVHSNP
jgi:hypothetical protein